MKNYLKISLVPIISILALSIIFSAVNLFNMTIHPMVYIVLSIVIFFIYGYLISKFSTERGYIKAIIACFLYILAFFLLSLIFKYQLSLYMIIYYLILIISSALGAMASNLKKNS